MKKIEYIILGISLAITAIISTVAGLAGSAIVGSFWAWFWLTFLVQLVGFVAWNSYLLQKQNAEAEKTEIALLEQLSRFTVALSCAYCKQSNIVPIQLNQKNTFKCESCNQVNGVYMQFTATTLTTPIESVKLPLQDTNEVVEIKV